MVFSDEIFSSLLPTSSDEFWLHHKGARICYAFSDEIKISSLKKLYFVKIFSNKIQISSLLHTFSDELWFHC